VDITAVSQDSSIADLIGVILERGHSRLPVFQDNIDHIQGILLAKDLLEFWNKPDTEINLTRFCGRLFYSRGQRRSAICCGILWKKDSDRHRIDEYGGTSGLITIEDILEEIVGEIYDEYETQELRLVPQDDAGSVIVDARLRLKIWQSISH
jgi:magnesium and cobalt transporter